MGMDAEIIAIGPFHRDLAVYLGYPPSYYNGTQEFSEVVTTVFHCWTTSGSQELAEIFNIDPWDFSSHHLDPFRFDESRFQAAKEEGLGLDGDAKAFKALVEAGFEFYFLPNG